MPHSHLMADAQALTSCYRLSLSDAMTWKRRAYNKLLQTEDIQPIVKRARNVILFLGDGMGISTVTAARMLNGDETSLLYFENFPNVALSKVTFSVRFSTPCHSNKCLIFTAFLHTYFKGLVGCNFFS